MREDGYVTAVLEEKVDQILSEGRKSMGILAHQHRHAAWHALKQSTWTRFGYWIQNCYSSQSIPTATKLDEGLHSLLELPFGLSIPLQRGSSTTVLDTPIPGREEWSFPAWVMRQPVKCGGMGLRSYAETCGPAFIGAIEMAIPTLHSRFGSILTNEVDGADMFGEGDGVPF